MRAALSIALLIALPAYAADAPSARIVVQHAPLAGFVYYDGKGVWENMKTGDRLALAREPSNPHDAKAIRIEWKGQMLGYVPRRDNADLARQMDLGARPEGRIAARTTRSGTHRLL